MVREETLRAIISAKETLGQTMRKAASGVRDLGEETRETARDTVAAAKSMDTTETVANSYKRTLSSLSRTSTEAAFSQEMLEEQIQEAGSAAQILVAQMRAAAAATDKQGDEARETAMENIGLAASFKAVGAAVASTNVNFGPFNTSVRRLLIALPALIAVLGALAAALLGVATAGFTAAGALAALFAGGLIGAAENMAATSADIEDRAEALQEIFVQLGGAIDEATEPIQQLAQQEMVADVLGGLVTIIGDLASSAAELAPLFGRVGDRLDEVFWAEEARGIAEVERMIAELMPFLEDLVFTILTQLPDLIAWLTQQTKRSGDAIGDFTTSFIALVRELTEVGVTIVRFTGPAFSLLFDVLAGLLDIVSNIPDPLLAAATAFAVAAVASTLYAGGAFLAAGASAAWSAAMAPLLGALGTLASILGAPVIAVAALIAAVVAIISWLGLWDDILNVIIGAWNVFVSILEYVINTIAICVKWLDNFLGVSKTVGGIIAWLAKLWQDFVEWLEPAVEFLQRFLELMNLIGDEARRQGGVSLEAAKLEQPAAAAKGGPSRGGSADTMAGASPGVRERSRELRGGNQYSFDFSGASFGGNMSQRTIEQMVRDAVEKAESQSSDT